MMSGTWVCGACSTTNGAGADRCVVCQVAAPWPVDPGAEPRVPVATAARTAAEVPVAGWTGAPNRPPNVPGHSGPLAAPDSPRRSPLVPVLAGAGVLLLVVVGGLVGVATGGGSDDGATPAPTISTMPEELVEAEAEGTVMTAPATAATRPSTVPTPTGPSTTTLGAEPVDRWITVLYSRPKAEHTLAQVDAEAARLAADHGDSRVRVLDSDASRHMNGGFWVIVLVDFDTRAAAVAACDAFGIPVGDCYPRQTSTGER